MVYKAHRRPSGGTPVAWSESMAYALGLVATDGCLGRDGRHIIFDSSDRQLVETFLDCVGRPDASVGQRRTRTGGVAYRAQLSDRRLYDWLVERGLTPAKSLTLGALDVPDDLFRHTARGLLDGDGSIYVKRQRPTRRLHPDYSYLRLWTYFTSASRAHVEWLRTRIRAAYGIGGWLECDERADRRPFYRLRFGKRDSIVLLSSLYASAESPALVRKRDIWIRYRETQLGLRPPIG
jgi:hypothetical protein